MNVGKTSIILRFVNDIFKIDYKSTIVVDMKMINVEYNNHTAQLVIWDSAGQERFQSMTKNYYKNSDTLSGKNIDELFEDIVSTIIDNKYLLSYDNNSIRLSIGTHTTKKERTAECC